MFRPFLSLAFALFLFTSVFAEKKFSILKDLRADWMKYEDGSYKPLDKLPLTGLNTVYFVLKAGDYPGGSLRLISDKPFFVFLNGKVAGEYTGEIVMDIDSLSRAVRSSEFLVAIHRNDIRERDLKTEIASTGVTVPPDTGIVRKPYSHFRDFVVISGLLIILLFLVELRLNPKLASDYFSVARMFSSREVEDSQASARLTSGSNVQFYVLCSLMTGFYLLIILYNLPSTYALPVRFHATGFWTTAWQWLKLSAIIFMVFMLKLSIIFSMTRLFGMRGMARFHFFNWMRLLLLVFGTATVVVFIYFISRGDSPVFFVLFLSLVIAVLIAWIVVAIFKLTGRTGHSIFHLFSYLCATEIIPLLITVKVLFQ
ncbi:MAG TPA: DUF4271 domain-containing protein [Chryseosolibacter sp.]